MRLDNPGFFDFIAANYRRHGRSEKFWSEADAELATDKPRIRDELERGEVSLGPLGPVCFDYVEMGAINSLDLLGLDELILLSFYWINRNRYRRVGDLGANLGLHSIFLGLLDIRVTAYEPDPSHLTFLRRHVRNNGLLGVVDEVEAAVAAQAGTYDFIRVLGNTTGSHISGAKANLYGDLETFPVRAVSVAEAAEGKDLIKMDVEGLEAELLTALNPKSFQNLDIVCEIGSQKNGQIVWEHFRTSRVNLFSQKRGWAKVESVEDMPIGYKEGSLFITCLEEMPWEKD